MNKIYLVTYNLAPTFDHAAFHKHIDSLFKGGIISDWWHYTDTAYLVASSLPVNNIYNSVFPVIPQRYLLIIEVDPNNAQGWLPKEAWSWIQKYQRKA